MSKATRAILAASLIALPLIAAAQSAGSKGGFDAGRLQRIDVRTARKILEAENVERFSELTGERLDVAG